MNNKDCISLISSENKEVAIRQIVQTVCIFNFADVTARELDLLCELLASGGVNEQSKKRFLINYKTSKENYGQLIKRLSDKGILINKDHRNGKELHNIFEQLIKLYIHNNKTALLAVLWKVDS